MTALIVIVPLLPLPMVKTPLVVMRSSSASESSSALPAVLSVEPRLIGMPLAALSVTPAVPMMEPFARTIRAPGPEPEMSSISPLVEIGVTLS